MDFEMDVEDVLSNLTLNEKVSLLSGMFPVLASADRPLSRRALQASTVGTPSPSHV